MAIDPYSHPLAAGSFQIDRRAVGDLCRRYLVSRLDLFGSGSGERFDPARSDLDFVVAFQSMSPADYAEAYFGLREALGRTAPRCPGDSRDHPRRGADHRLL